MLVGFVRDPVHLAKSVGLLFVVQIVTLLLTCDAFQAVDPKKLRPRMLRIALFASAVPLSLSSVGFLSSDEIPGGGKTITAVFVLALICHMALFNSLQDSIQRRA